MLQHRKGILALLGTAGAGVLLLLALSPLAPANEPAEARLPARDPIAVHAERMLGEGRQTFRYDTFGDQVFWSRTLRIHEALKTVTPRTALSVGLKVDAEAVPSRVLANADLDDPATTAALLRRDACAGTSTRTGPSGRRASPVPCATRPWTTRSRPGSASGSTAGPTGT